MIISIVNQKGGVGKTVTAVNLAGYLANFDKKVLLIDIDPQANATSGIGVDPNQVHQGIYESLIGLTTLSQVIINSAKKNLDLIPATPSLAGANVELVGMERRAHRLADLLPGIKGGYDFLIIDCPPSLGLLTICGIVAADQILIPVQAEYFALEGLGQLLNTINLAQQNLKPNLSILGTLLTMYDGRTRLSKEVWQELYQHFPGRIFRTVIPRSVKLAEAPSFGQTILEYAPDSSAARAYLRLTKELLSFRL